MWGCMLYFCLEEKLRNTVLCRYTQVYQQDTPLCCGASIPHLCRAVAAAPGSTRPGRYLIQATGQQWGSFLLNNVMPPWASCWSPGSQPHHTLSSLIPQFCVTWHVRCWEARCKPHMVTENTLALALALSRDRTQLKQWLPVLAMERCSDPSVSLLFAAFILASVPPEHNICAAFQLLHLQEGTPSSPADLIGSHSAAWSSLMRLCIISRDLATGSLFFVADQLAHFQGCYIKMHRSSLNRTGFSKHL